MSSPSPRKHPATGPCSGTPQRGYAAWIARGNRVAHRARMVLGALLVVTVAGCSALGGGKAARDTTIYTLDPRIAADPAWPATSWQMTISPPTAARMIDSFRIAVRPTPGVMQVYKGASWSRTPTDMVVDSILRTLEDSGKINGVARQGAGITATYRLVIDMRRFESTYDGNALPSATIELNAKLVHSVGQDVVATRTFLHAEPAAGTDVPSVIDAFSRSLAVITTDVSGWVLASGGDYERNSTRAAPAPTRR